MNAHEELLSLGMAFLLACAFLLRLPSEALPVVAHAGGVHGTAVLRQTGEKLILSLRRRKNKPTGSELTVGCWCRECKETCPVHRIDPFLASVPEGAKLFPNISAANALSGLRNTLALIEVGRAESYRCHDLRRGHARDLQASGIPLNLEHFLLDGCTLVRRSIAHHITCR